MKQRLPFILVVAAAAALGLWAYSEYEVKQLVPPVRKGSVQLSEYIEMRARPRNSTWKDHFAKAEATLAALDEARVHVKATTLTLSDRPKERALAYLSQAQEIARFIEKVNRKRFEASNRLDSMRRNEEDFGSSNEYTRARARESWKRDGREAEQAIKESADSKALLLAALPALTAARLSASRSLGADAVLEEARLADLQAIGKEED
jgi:hypothetical protein